MNSIAWGRLESVETRNIIGKMGSQTDCQVPVIDFSDENLQPGTDTWVRACQVVRTALEDHGCFYALSHKVPMGLYNSVFTLMEELFDLPLETKMQETSDKPHHGYYGPTSKFPLYESIGIDDPLSKEAVQKFAKIMWPERYDHFCESLNLYAKLLVELDQTGKRMVFDGYDLDKRHCDSLLESTNYLVRSFKYRVPQKTESNLGLHAHTDTSFFTILHQNNVTGLQVKLKNGEWVDADPSPCMFLFLAGDAFKVWSSERIRPCKHQIIIREEKERCSMGLFSFSSKMIQTQEELVDEEHPVRYKPFDHYEYIHFSVTKEASKYECRVKAYCGIDFAGNK